MKLTQRILCITLILIIPFLFTEAFSQKKKQKNINPVYVDKNGVMRWRESNKEAAFFGVNYTTPFAFAYRAHKTLGVDLEKAIREDVYHMARLGFDAFRVHVWDNEISDVDGNLLDNEHLRLYDFLLAELKKRNIKTIITPIAFWGNGYPERDENTPGFSNFYGRQKLTTNDSAIVAQENYLKQLFNHVNPYTKLSYQDDPDVIAAEINNEPAHSGPKKDVTNYINRLADAIKKTGWTKPIFYNISQGPYYADAVAASTVDGFSFQWYPSGLVSGKTLKGNYLPNIDQYTIPFDTIQSFLKKPLMVYEFDAADILDPIMYPVMARSFRQAGFQWATQFAYDPMAIAYANTEYQTHYLNLAYTPSKAISMLIASRVFHQIPRLKNYGSYPANSTFDVFRVSYEQSLSEMNAEHEFFYSNTTTSKPKKIEKLKHIAGVGSSPIVSYSGTGAYFLDQIEIGVWRLEVMPDAIFIRDPFERSSPKKEVVRIQWSTNQMKVEIPDLSEIFSVRGINENNTYSTSSTTGEFSIPPGTYILSKDGKTFTSDNKLVGVTALNEFVAPQQTSTEMVAFHEPYRSVTANKSFTISTNVVGIDSGKVTLYLNQVGGRFKNIPMTRTSRTIYSAEVPADIVTPGLLNYRIVLQKDEEYITFPGNIKGNPFAWDNYHSETWKTFVAAENGELEIFNPTDDQRFPSFPVWRRGFRTSYSASDTPNQLQVQLHTEDLKGVELMGFQYSFVDKVIGRKEEMNSFTTLVIRAKSTTAPLQSKVTLIFSDGSAISAPILISGEFQNIEIPIRNFKPDNSLLMPRPYPHFLPLTFKSSTAPIEVDLSTAEKIEITTGENLTASEKIKSYSLAVEYIRLSKKK